MSDMTVIEKMARAIYAQIPGSCDASKPWTTDDYPLAKKMFEDCARAALSALQEPTDAMVIDGGKALIDARMNDKMLDHQLNAVFTAMIKAAEGES